MKCCQLQNNSYTSRRGGSNSGSANELSCLGSAQNTPNNEIRTSLLEMKLQTTKKNILKAE